MDIFPNPDRVTIQAEKLTGYLLSLTHPIGKGKAKWFRKIGFDESNVDLFDHELRQFPLDYPLIEIVPSPPYGTKYLVEGELIGPFGRGIVRTVWQIDAGETIPRLISAYPINDEDNDD